MIEQALDEPTNLNLTAIYNSDSFTHLQVMAGMWNFATIEVFSVCWSNVNLGELVHMVGNLGEFKDRQRSCETEARGKISRLSQEVEWVTSRLCRAPEFQDPVFCKHTATTVVIGGTTYNINHAGLTLVSDWAISDTIIPVFGPSFTGTLPPNNFFANGKITCTLGDNIGVSREVAASLQNGINIDIQLKRPFPYPATTADVFTLKAGCTKTLEDCIKFGNVVNRRAEDYIPGIESVNRLPSAT